MEQKQMNPGDGYNPNQQTFILMWNPAFSSVTMDYHLYCIENFDTEPFDWSVYEWEKARIGDRFYLVRVGDGNTGIVMSGVFTSEPYVAGDWNKQRNSKQIHYMDMRPNFIVNPETMPIVTTAQLQEAIPDFEWRRGHSGVLLNENQAERLEQLFADYLVSVQDLADGVNLVIDVKTDLKRFERYIDTHGRHIETIMPTDVFVDDYLPRIGNWTMYKRADCIFSNELLTDKNVEIVALRKGSEMGMTALILNAEENYELLTVYPTHRGMKHRLRITKIQEWKSHVEAIVYAETEELSLAFFATDYYVNKDKYSIGSQIDVELAACAYSLSEGEAEIVLDMETSARMRKDMGIEEQYDEDGKLQPLVLYNEDLVAFLSEDGDYPDEVAFASKVKSVKKVSLFGKEFFRAIISICHDPEETYIPLYLKKELMENIHKGTLLRGGLWLQGQLPD